MPNPYAPPQAEVLDLGPRPAQSGIVQSVAVGLVLATVLWDPLSFQPLHNRLAWHGLQVAFGCGLALPLGRGVAWARWIVVATCAAIGAEQLYTGSVLHEIFRDAPVVTLSLPLVCWIVFGVALLHFALAALLVLPRSVRDFYAGSDRAA